MMMVFMWILAVFVGLLLLGWLVPPVWFATRRSNGNRAEEILKRRYASGEIDRETYNRMLDDLQGLPSRQHA